MTTALAAKLRGSRYRDLVIALSLVGVVAALSTSGFKVLGGFPPLYEHLGAEYFNIARAIVDGRGFSDPFGEPSGPTAWMPPLLPFLLAALLAIFKTKAAVGTAIAAITVVAHAAIAFSILVIARRCRRRLSPMVAVAIYLGWLCAFYYWFFEFTHDIWLTCVIAACIVWRVSRYVVDGERAPVRWGLVGGLASLASPTLLFGWAALTCACFVSESRDRRKVLVAACIAVAVACPWVARNAVVFGRFIPSKSNVFYDAYAANVVDDDGVYDHMSTARHPYGSPSVRFEYARAGETAYLETCRRRFIDSVRSNPLGMMKRTLNRLAASVLVYPSIDRGSKVTWGTVVRRAIYPLPLLGTILALGLCRRGHMRRWWTALALLAGVYLLPYVVLAFYARYTMGIAPVLALLAFAGADELAARQAALRTNLALRSETAP